MNETVSFVIRTKNEAKDLGKACAYIKSQKGDFKSEIIIVDSGSTDETLVIADEHADQIIKIPEEDFSWGYALNVGINAATGKYIFLLSAHCFLVKEEVVDNGIKIMKRHGFDALYGRQIGDPNKNLYECVELSNFYPQLELESSEDGEIHGISNACCILKKKVWENNVFDEKLQSSEDLEWYKRVTEKGGKIGYTSKIELIHGHYLDISYVYKKDYWREYTGRNCVKYIFSGIFSKPIYIYATRLLHVLKAFAQYMRALNKLGVDFTARELLKYLFIKDMAIANARRDYIKGGETNKCYEEIEVPNYVNRLK